MTFLNETPDAPVTLPGEVVIFDIIPLPVPVLDCVPCVCENPSWVAPELPPDFVPYNLF